MQVREFIYLHMGRVMGNHLHEHHSIYNNPHKYTLLVYILVQLFLRSDLQILQNPSHQDNH